MDVYMMFKAVKEETNNNNQITEPKTMQRLTSVSESEISLNLDYFTEVLNDNLSIQCCDSTYK